MDSLIAERRRCDARSIYGKRHGYITNNFTSYHRTPQTTQDIQLYCTVQEYGTCLCRTVRAPRSIHRPAGRPTTDGRQYGHCPCVCRDEPRRSGGLAWAAASSREQLSTHLDPDAPNPAGRTDGAAGREPAPTAPKEPADGGSADGSRTRKSRVDAKRSHLPCLSNDKARQATLQKDRNQ